MIKEKDLNQIVFLFYSTEALQVQSSRLLQTLYQLKFT